MIVKVVEWSIVEQPSETRSKRPEFSVVVTDGTLSSKAFQVQVPYNPIIDTTIAPDTHDLFIDNSMLNITNGKVVKTNVFFRKKTISETGAEPKASSFANTPVGVGLANKIDSQRRAIIDDSGTGVTVSKDAAAIGTPGQEMIVGKTGVTMLSGSPKIPDLPQEDHVLFKESGLGRLMPRCFVPPFCFPAFMPSVQFIAQVAGTITMLKEIDKLTRKSF